MRGAVPKAAGGWVPSRVVAGHELPEAWGVDGEGVRSRTGIAARHRVGLGVATGDLVVAAGLRVFYSAGDRQVDEVVLATSSPHRPCPVTAPAVATCLGQLRAFDLGSDGSGGNLITVRAGARRNAADPHRSPLVNAVSAWPAARCSNVQRPPCPSR